MKSANAQEAFARFANGLYCAGGISRASEVFGVFPVCPNDKIMSPVCLATIACAVDSIRVPSIDVRHASDECVDVVISQAAWSIIHFNMSKEIVDCALTEIIRPPYQMGKLMVVIGTI